MKNVFVSVLSVLFSGCELMSECVDEKGSDVVSQWGLKCDPQTDPGTDEMEVTE